MLQFFLIAVVYIIKISLYVLIGSLKLVWVIIKGEFYLIRESFRKYPIGFFSFFLHFLGFWFAIGLSENTGIGWLCRLYTLGLFGDAEQIIDMSMKLFDWLGGFTGDSSSLWYFIGSFVMVYLLFPTVLLSFEILLFLFPIIYAALTQLIFGAIFRQSILRWRKRRNDKALKQYVREVARTRNEEVNRQLQMEQMTQQQVEPLQIIEDEETGLCKIQFVRNSRPPIRDMDKTYESVLERINMRTFKIREVYEELVRRRGRNSQIQRLYDREMEVHQELQGIYLETSDIISYSEDMEEVEQAYADLKRAMILLKNAQADLVDEMKKVYGVNV